MERDLGLIDDFFDDGPRTKNEKCFNQALKLVRSDEVAKTMVKDIKRMRVAKQKELMIRAYNSLNTKEWTIFKAKTTDLMKKGVKMLELQITVPFGNNSAVEETL